MATNKLVLRGESHTILKAAIQEERIDDKDGCEMALALPMVTAALAGVTATVFPHSIGNSKTVDEEEFENTF